MTNYQKLQRKLAIVSLAIIGLSLLAILFMPKAHAQSMAKDHAKLQKELSFENVMSRNGYGTVKEAKELYNEKKRSNRESKKKSRVIARRNLYLTKARELGVK